MTQETLNFTAQKAQIIEKIKANFTNTAPEYRYYTEQNITECDQALARYLPNLTTLNPAAPDLQSKIKAQIAEICAQLSTFGDESEAEYPEYSFGFLYSEFGSEIAELVVRAAFAAGLRDSRRHRLNTQIFYLQSSDFSPFRIYIGQDDEHGICLEYNVRRVKFELNETPYYDPTLIGIFDLNLSSNERELGFAVLSRHESRYMRYLLCAQTQADEIWLKFIYDLHTQQLKFSTRKLDFADVRLGFERGMLYELDVLGRDEAGRVIDVSQPIFPRSTRAESIIRAEATASGSSPTQTRSDAGWGYLMTSLHRLRYESKAS